MQPQTNQGIIGQFNLQQQPIPGQYIQQQPNLQQSIPGHYSQQQPIPGQYIQQQPIPGQYNYQQQLIPSQYNQQQQQLPGQYNQQQQMSGQYNQQQQMSGQYNQQYNQQEQIPGQFSSNQNRFSFDGKNQQQQSGQQNRFTPFDTNYQQQQPDIAQQLTGFQQNSNQQMNQNNMYQQWSQSSQQYPVQQEIIKRQLNNNNQFITKTDSFIETRQFPQQFDDNYYKEILRQNCIKYNLDAFDLFSEQDIDGNFTLKSENNLMNIFNKLTLNPPYDHIRSFYQIHRQRNKDAMEYLPILKEFFKPSQLMRKIILFSIKVNKFSLDIFFNKILNFNKSKNTKFWTIQELIFFNDQFNINYHANILQDIWQEWCPGYKQDKQLTLNELAQILQVSEFNPQQLNNFQQSQPDACINEINQRCKNYNVSCIDLFTYFDQDFDYTIKNEQLLLKILSLLGISINQQDLGLVFNHFKDRKSNKMKYIRLIRSIQQPSIIMKSIFLNVMKVNKFNLLDMFAQIQSPPGNKKYLDIQDIIFLNNELDIQLDPQDIQQIFQTWAQNNRVITLQEIEQILGIRQHYTADQIGIQYTKQMQEVIQRLEENSSGRSYNQNLANNYPINNSKPKENKDLTQYEIDQIYGFLDSLTPIVNQKGFNFFIYNSQNNMINQAGFMNALADYKIPVTSQSQGFIDQIFYSQGGQISLQNLKEMIQYNESAQEMDIQKNQQQSTSKQQNISAIENQNNKFTRKQLGIVAEEDDEFIQRQNMEQFQVDRNKAIKAQQAINQIFNNNTQQINQYFFPNNGKPLITLNEFIELASFEQLQLLNLVTINDLKHLFYFMDANQGGSVSLMEFKMVFSSPNETKKGNKKNTILPKQLEDDIIKMFKEMDVDNSGKLELTEIANAFSKIGINCNPVDIDHYIQRYDKNGDGQICYDEFKEIFEEKLRNELLTAEDLIDELRREFQKVDVKNTRLLNIAQLDQVMKNIGAQLSQEELHALFNEIDIDKSRTIDIDEMIYFITKKNNDTTSSLAQSAVLNIRLCKKLSLAELKQQFQNMPSNFRNSFIRNQLKKCKQLPSSVFKPKLDITQCYIDLKYSQLLNINDANVSCIERNIPLNFVAEIKIDYATGVPIPDKNQIQRHKLIYREIYMTLFDQQKMVFIGNTIRLQARWEPDYEDRWYFNPTKIQNENVIQVVIADFDQKRDLNLCICVEFSLHYISNVKSTQFNDIEMSCCYGLIKVSELLRPGAYSCQLQGGEPNNLVVIKKDDIRTNREGWRALVKVFTPAIQTCLKYYVLEKPDKKIMEDLATMPSRLLILKNSLPFLKAFREYFAFHSIAKNTIDPNLAQDGTIKLLLKIIDQSDTFHQIIKFWTEIENKYKNLKDQYIQLKQIATHSFILFSHNDFKFISTDPTASCYCFSQIQKRREELIRNFIEDLRYLCKLKTGASSSNIYKSNKLIASQNCQPFNMKELIEDNEEEEIDMIEQYIQKKNLQQTQMIQSQMHSHHSSIQYYSGKKSVF